MFWISLFVPSYFSPKNITYVTLCIAYCIVSGGTTYPFVPFLLMLLCLIPWCGGQPLRWPLRAATSYYSHPVCPPPFEWELDWVTHFKTWEYDRRYRLSLLKLGYKKTVVFILGDACASGALGSDSWREAAPWRAPHEWSWTWIFWSLPTATWVI